MSKKTKRNTISIIAIITILILIAILLTSCQTAARTMGGTYTLELEKGEKLLNVTWKEDVLWYLTRPMGETDVAETYEFKAKTTTGLLEGKVIIKESK